VATDKTAEREAKMMSIDIKRFGLAWGVVGAFLYIGCAFIMMTAGKENVVFFFNSLFHGVDVAPILRTDMPFWEMILGAFETFVFSWLVGASIASIYNASLKTGHRR
jgi:hypothetical protein